MTTTMSDKDKGAIARLRALADLDKRSVEVGVLGEKAAEAAESGEGLTVSDVATINEFGLGVPQRSFIRGYVDERRKDVLALLGRMATAVAAGKITAQVGYEALGLKIAANIQERISAGIEPANAPATIARKGSSKPLINTGQLRSAIAPRVVTR